MKFLLKGYQSGRLIKELPQPPMSLNLVYIKIDGVDYVVKYAAQDYDKDEVVFYVVDPEFGRR